VNIKPVVDLSNGINLSPAAVPPREQKKVCIPNRTFMKDNFTD
jgi:hypothetical protein